MKDEKKRLKERENMNDGYWNAVVFFFFSNTIETKKKVRGDKEVTQREKREKSRLRENNLKA